ncbi:Pectinesterase 3 [Linum perenne]
MESIKLANGYDKVNTTAHIESQPKSHHKTKSRKPLIAAATVAVVLVLGIILAVTLVAVIHHNKKKSPNPENLPPASSTAESIRAVCNVTRYPNPCFTAISSAMGSNSASDPESILKVSIQVSLIRVSDLASVLRNSSSKSQAVVDCVDQMEEAKSNLNQSIAGMEEKPLAEERIADLKTWISAAMTDEETCRDGMEEAGETVAEGVNVEMEDCKEMMSNSLAILANLPALVQSFRLRHH